MTNTLCGDATCTEQGPWPHPLSGSCDRDMKRRESNEIHRSLGLDRKLHVTTSVIIYHRGASLSEQHADLLCTKQDLSHTSRFVDESSPKIARYCIRMPTARTATLNVTTYA